MYSLWVAEANEHVAKAGHNAGKTVSNDAYKQSGQFDRIAQATDAFMRKLADSKPGTKVKLIGTVPEPVMSPVDEVAKLKARLALLEGKAV